MILSTFSRMPFPMEDATVNAVSVQMPVMEPMWLYSLSISARTVLISRARLGISVPDSMISEYAMQFATHVSPEILSTNLESSTVTGFSSSFSTPRCVNPSQGLSSMTVSPATLNLKWPGSIMPAWTGPTGISNTSSPTVRLGCIGMDRVAE